MRGGGYNDFVHDIQCYGHIQIAHLNCNLTEKLCNVPFIGGSDTPLRFLRYSNSPMAVIDNFYDVMNINR